MGKLRAACRHTASSSEGGMTVTHESTCPMLSKGAQRIGVSWALRPSQAFSHAIKNITTAPLQGTSNCPKEKRDETSCPLCESIIL